MVKFDAEVLTARRELADWFEMKVKEANGDWESVVIEIKKKFGNNKEWPGEYGNEKPRGHWPQKGAVHPIEIGEKITRKLKKEGILTDMNFYQVDAGSK